MRSVVACSSPREQRRGFSRERREGPSRAESGGTSTNVAPLPVASPISRAAASYERASGPVACFVPGCRQRHDRSIGNVANIHVAHAAVSYRSVDGPLGPDRLGDPMKFCMNEFGCRTVQSMPEAARASSA